MASDVTVIQSGVRGVAIFPRVLFNSSLDINLYFKDPSGNFLAHSGAAGYTPSLKIRQPKGFNALSGTRTGTIDISDGATTRSINLNTGAAALTRWDNAGNAFTGQHGLLGGYNGAGAGDGWIFNGGSLGAGVSAAAVWAATRCTNRGSLGVFGADGTAIIEADTVGNQAALSFSNNLANPAVEGSVVVLRQGTASLRELVLIRIVPPAAASVSAFTQITNGWSCTVPFTDPAFITLSNTANITVSEYQDYACEIIITRDSDSAVMCVASATIRVYRKQIDLTV